jgi:hypothetical protein
MRLGEIEQHLIEGRQLRLPNACGEHRIGRRQRSLGTAQQGAELAVGEGLALVGEARRDHPGETCGRAEAKSGRCPSLTRRGLHIGHGISVIE